MAWTEMQYQAIHKRGQNIIVSAGAGSGKTAVLSERILEYCLDGKDICSFLVLTFTNAAAAEMKNRIRKKLIEHNLKEQASKIDSAFITTFDAFSLALVKKYYFHLNLEKDITILDSSLLEVKKKEFIESMFEELYQKKDNQFFSLLEKYTKQNDDMLKKMILQLLSKMDLIVDHETFYKTYQDVYYTDSFLDALLCSYEKLSLQNVKDVYHALEKLLDLSSVDSASVKMYEEIKKILSLADMSTYDTAYVWVNQITLPRSSTKALEQVKLQKTLCGEILKEVKQKYFSKYIFLQDARIELQAIQDDVLYILNLAMQLKRRLDDYKYKIMAFDYMDIAKFAIQLVKTKPIVLKEIKQSFTEILIDEYQDTSDIQEAFISLIANENCYMVGDIKQSIYRFRNANPYIFKNKYSQYTNHKNGVKIDLTYNFRSRKEVIEDINLIFSNLMTLQIGDANYSFEHMMHFGQTNYEKMDASMNYHMDILSYDSLEGYTDEEVEAFICGNKIKELIQRKPLCLKGDTYQTATYSDIAILMDKTKSFVTFKKVLESLKIPVSIDADLDLKDSVLPKLFSNIITLIIKRKMNVLDKTYEHCLVSIGRSFLFEFDDTKLYLMIKNKESNELIETICTLADEVDTIAIEELYYRIVDAFFIYEKLSLIGEVDNSCIVLDYIHSLFVTMADAGMDLVEASQYLEGIFENGIALKYKLTEQTKDCVHLMTIHKSKGLEFPYCFFPMLGSKFNQVDIKENFGLSLTYGIYIPFSDETNSNTIIKPLVEAELKQADLSEKIRLFYVALTRAREKIFLISKNLDTEDVIPIEKCCSFNQFLHTKVIFKDFRHAIDLSEMELNPKYRMLKPNLRNLNGKKIVYQQDSYDSTLYSKGAISKELIELTDSALKRSIELGKKFHECLEVLNFSDVHIDELPIDAFMKQALKKILTTSVFKNISSAKTYHEHEFYDDNYHGIIDLLCIYEDHVDIIDYKLSNTESAEYLRQLEIYKNYVQKHTQLPISCYLLSILKQEVKKVL